MPQQNQTESLSSLLSAKAIRRKDSYDLTGLVIIFNSESCYHFYSNSEFRKVVESCSSICIDGIGVQLALFLRGKIVRRFHGPDLLSDLVFRGQGLKFSLLGGACELAEEDVRGVFHSHIPLPVSDDINGLFVNAVEAIEMSGKPTPNYLVSLGLPKQELFSGLLANYLKRYKEKWVIIPVGAAIDFHFGYKLRSSKFWQRLGLEWLPRLVREPRMIKRLTRSVSGVIRLAMGC